MKNKKSFWLAVVTLVLCLGVMATGIYAAKTAMLKLGGTLGFNMHDCMIEVNGTIQNVAQKQQDGSYKKTTKTIENAIMGGETGETITNLDLGALEFYSGADMIFELTFKNLSSHSVAVSIELVNANGKINPVESALYDQLPTGNIISVGGTVTVTFALRLIDETSRVDGSAFEIVANFEEFTVRNLLEYDETYGYYLEMGTEDGTPNGTPLRWFPFAYSEDGISFASKDSTEELASGTYYFISEKVLLKDTSDNGVAFNSKSYASAEYYNALDYAYESTVRPLVNDGADNANSVYSTYGMAGSPIYNAITNRDLAGEEYEWYPKADSDDYDTYETKTTHTAYNQTLWLIARGDELDMLAGEKDVSYSETLKANPVGSANDDYTSWWLRSPNYAYSYGCADVWSVGDYGNVGSDDVSTSGPGVRPAFQITIA